MNYLIESMRMLILMTIASAIIGFIFWPENLGRAHKIIYNDYMTGWNSR